MYRYIHSIARQNSHFIFSFSLGFIVIMFLAPVYDNQDCISFKSKADFMGARQPEDMYEPKINLAAKPRSAVKGGHGMKRPRFHKAELGIRNKLFVGVLTSPESISTLAVAFNKTASRYIDKIMYFIDAPSAQRLNVSSLKLPGIVGFTDTRKLLKPFHLIKYVSDNFLEDYDYFFIVKDTAYIQAQKLYEFAKKISINRDVHMGKLIVNNRDGDSRNICSLDSGILLSNSLLRKVQKSLEWCVKKFITNDDSTNIGQCIIHSSQLECSEDIQGTTFQTWKIKKQDTHLIIPSNPVDLKSFQDSIVIFPLKDVAQYYNIHLYFVMETVVNLNKAVDTLRNEVTKTNAKTPESLSKVWWPTASQPPATALSHFDVLRWEYFTLTHKYLNSDFSNVISLSGSEQEDIQVIVNKAISFVEETYNNALKFNKFINGYKRCDPSRGMDYIIDAEFWETTSGTPIHKRLELFKSLGKLETVSVPYVTENVRVHVIMPVKSSDIERIMFFLKHYSINAMEKKDLQFLMLVFIYKENDSSKGDGDIFKEVKLKAISLSNKFEKFGNNIKWHSIKLPRNTSKIAYSESILDFIVLDSVLKKFTSESLVLLARPNMEVRLDYFNRVRMNTVSEFQIFSPIPFAEYHPEIIYNENHPQPPEVEINKNNGHYDFTDFTHLSFYVVDYFKARKNIEDKIPLIKNDKDIWKLIALPIYKNQSLDVFSSDTVYNMFVEDSKVHILRAVEPSLRLKHTKILTQCTKADAFNLATRSQLGRLILDYQASNSLT